MCGFLLAPSHLVENKTMEVLNSIAHRGADGLRGVGVQAGWTLFHHRLAVATYTHNSNGDQPFITPSGDLMAFVGEFFPDDIDEDDPQPENDGYSHFEFEKLDQAFYSNNLEGFMNQDGFWSAIRVRPNGEATILTDHLGIKPIYYWEEHRVFCSEIGPMFSLGLPLPALDPEYFDEVETWGYSRTGRTPFDGIHQMRPGTAIDITPTAPTLFEDLPSMRIRTYWDWNRVHRPISVWGLRTTIDRMIRVRALSTFPVGLLLSGGLDSSIVYHSLRRQGLLDGVRIFSIDNGEFGSLPDDPDIIRLPAPEAPDLDETLDAMGSPVDLGSVIPQIQLAKALRQQGARAVLTGDGADELFGGYRRAKEADTQSTDVFCELPYYHLPRLDKVMMAYNLEVRSPFLAPAVAAFALDLPHSKRTHKQMLREAFPDLPAHVLTQKKVPLKSRQVLDGGMTYRRQLIHRYIERYNEYVRLVRS